MTVNVYLLFLFFNSNSNTATCVSVFVLACVQDGITYVSGQKIPLGDGCNECDCKNGTLISCGTTVCRKSQSYSYPKLYNMYITTCI